MILRWYLLIYVSTTTTGTIDYGWGLLAIHQSIPSRLVSSPLFTEAICVQVTSQNPYVVCIVYLPPNPPVHPTVSSLDYLASITEEFPHVVIMGDFNLPNVNWSCPDVSVEVCELLKTHSLDQLVFWTNLFLLQPTSRATFLTWCLSPTLIWYVTSKLILMFSCLVWPWPLSRQILYISSQVNRSKSSVPSVPCFIFSKGDYEGMNKFFTGYDYSCFYTSCDVEFLWAFMIILHAGDLFIPKQSKSGSRLPKRCNFPTPQTVISF